MRFRRKLASCGRQETKAPDTSLSPVGSAVSGGQAGLLASGSSRSAAFPTNLMSVACLANRFPVTVAGPRRIRTGLPS